MDIGPGDVVICISEGPDDLPALTVGRRYTVENIYEAGTQFRMRGELYMLLDTGIALFEIKGGRGLPVVYDVNHFTKRPPQREELFKSLLEPVVINEPVELEPVS